MKFPRFIFGLRRFMSGASNQPAIVFRSEKDFGATNCMIRPNPEAKRSIPDEVSTFHLWTTQVHVRCIEPTRNRLQIGKGFWRHQLHDPPQSRSKAQYPR